MGCGLILVAASWSAVGCAGGLPEARHEDALAPWRLAGLAEAAPSVETADVRERVRELLGAPLTPETAVEVALLASPRMQATVEEFGVARADLLQARLATNPRLGLSARWDSGSGGSTNTEWDIALDLLDALLTPLRARVAAQEFEATRARLGHQILEFVAEVRRAYFEFQAQEERVELMRTATEATAAAAELAHRQRVAGATGGLALAQQEAFHAEELLILARAEVQALAARERLNRLLGLWGEAVRWEVSPRLPSPPETEPTVERVESLAVERRLDLEAARRERDAAEQALRLARRFRWFGFFEFGVSSERDTDGETVTGPHIGFDLPIFDRRQARLARLEASLRRSEQRLTELAVDVRSEAREARLRLHAARDAVTFYREAVLPLRERVVEETQLRYNAMLLGVYELLQARRDQINGGLAYIDALMDYWLARVELERAAAGGLDGSASVPSGPQEPETAPAPHHEHTH